MSAKKDRVMQEVFRLRKQVEESNEKNNKLEEKVKSLMKQIEQLTEDNSRLSRQLFERSTERIYMEAHEKKWKKLEGAMKAVIQRLEDEVDGYVLNFDKLIIGEAACIFEHAICIQVLPEVYEKKNKIGSLHRFWTM